MRNLTWLAVGILGIGSSVALAGSASAAEATITNPETVASTYAVGARVGGYGFRDQDAAGKATWDDCRMNGIGVFGQRAMTRHLALEGGLDAYFADNTGLPGHDHGGEATATDGHLAMDRVSTIATIGAALTLLPGYRVTPTLSLGAGVELTRVSMDGHEPASRVMPMGYFGFGVDGRLWGRIHGGMNVRVNAMGHFEHDDPNMTEMDASPELATQGQFYLSVGL